ncbi:MAG: DNA repair protein RadA [Trueperaceae bacterium]|nr:DNA repair protein RadA [Trueperaceae bacterium]
MAKALSEYVCDACGAKSPAPMGRCPTCGAWDTMREVAPARGGPPGAPTGGASRAAPAARVTRLDAVEDLAHARIPSGDAEVDRVLGGGWVRGAALLLAGDPGVGKSTLLLQLARHAADAGRSVTYVAGEESLEQVKLRAARVGVAGALRVTRETDAHAIAAHVAAEAPAMVVVDSIQTLRVGDDGVPGSPTQVRDGTAVVAAAAKAAGSTVLFIGHVTKQGTIAGPKVVEHMVDATFALESAAGFRVLRAHKNRFGPVGEVGVFDMREDGMRAVANPSAAFLAERPEGVPGSVVVAALEGQRALLLEVQALASKSPYATPKRVVQGLDARRVDVVLAVLERRADLPLDGLDVFVNVAGGLRLTDPGADLAVAMAVWSAVTNRALPSDAAVVGEIGLAGEIRSVAHLERRRAEANRAGFATLLGPRHEALDGGGHARLGEALAAVAGPARAGAA